MKILNFGSINLDYVYKLPHFVSPGETINSNELAQYPGGKGLNQSIAISRAGAEVFHAGTIGNNGEILEEYLVRNNVKTNFLKRVDVIQGHAIIQVNADGENCIIIHGGSNRRLSEKYITETLDSFDKGTIVVLQNEINGVEFIINSAYERGMEVVYNPSPFDGSLPIDFNKISWLFINEIEGELLSGEKHPDGIIASLSSRYKDIGIVLTLGADGVICRKSNRIVRHNSYKVNVVDTTAAGDTFTGFFIAGLSRGEPLEQIIETSVKASAISVSREGASPSIPTAEEVNSMNYCG